MKKIMIITSLLLAGQIVFGALGITSLGPTNITTTSAYFRASVTTNLITPTNTLFYGTVDYTTNAASWAYSNVYGAGAGTISTQITGLSPSHKYYFRWRANDGTSNLWTSTTSSNFWTMPTAPTSTPAVVTISVQTDTNAVLKSPTNFFGANKALMNTALASYGFLTNEPTFTNWLPTFTAHTNNSGANILHLTTAEKLLATNAYQIQNGNSVSGQVAILNTNTAPLQSYLSTSNTLGIVLTNYFPLQSGLSGSNDLAIIKTNYTTIPAFTSHTNNSGANILHLTTAEKLLATNAVQPDNTNYLSIIRSMTNYVAVASATNYLTYDPATRLLTGCVTNSGGGLASDWSAYPATQTVAMASNNIVGVDDLLLAQFAQIWEKYEVKNITFPWGTVSRGGSYTVVSQTNQQSGAYSKFLVLTPLNRTNIFLNNPEDFINCMVLVQDSESGGLNVGINRAPDTTLYALDVAGAGHFDSINTPTVVTTNLQVTGGSPTNGAAWIATNLNGTGKWSRPCMFRVVAIDNANVLSNATAINLAWATETYDIGNNFSGATFTAPANGYYSFRVTLVYSAASGSADNFITYKFVYSGAALENKRATLLPGLTSDGYGVGGLDYYMTNGATMLINAGGTAAHTNNIRSISSFDGFLIRELP